MRDARLEIEDRDDVSAGPAIRPRAPVALAIAVAALGCLATGTAAWFWSRGGTAIAPSGPRRLSVLVPESVQLYPDSATVAISPDAAWIAYVAGAGGARQIWVRSTAELTSRLLTGTEGAQLPFWSADSRHVGFFAGGQLKTVAVDGGRVNVVCKAADGRGGTWNAADVIVFAEGVEGPLKRVSAAGGEPTPVTTLDQHRKETGHRFPSFLPDGDHFLFVVLPVREGKYDVAIGSLSSSSREAVGAFDNAAVYAPPGHLLFMRRNALVAQPFDATTRRLSGEPVPLDDEPAGIGFYFTAGPAVTVSSGGVLGYITEPPLKARLSWLDPSGKATDLDVPAAHYSEIQISPDGKRAAVVRRDGPASRTIWLVDLVRGGGFVPIATAPGHNWSPAWAPDSARLFFVSDREGPQQIYAKRVDDATPEELIFRSEIIFKQTESVSPNGEWLVFIQLTPQSQADIWSLPLTGPDRTPRPLVATAGNDVSPRVSPDGRFLAYLSTESGAQEAWVVTFPVPGRKVQVTTSGARGVSWRQDSRQLLVVGNRGSGIVDVLPGSEFRGSAVRWLGTTPPRPGSIVSVDIAPDFSRRLAAVRQEDTARPSLTIVTGWQAGVAKR